MKAEIILLCLVIALLGNHAMASSKSPKKGQESYAATEQEDVPAIPAHGSSEAPMAAPGAALVPPTAPISPPPAETALPVPLAAPQNLQAKVEVVPPKATAKPALFEPVPAEQIEAISKRLKLVDLILRKYGHAYDYRMHTLRELETVLAGTEPQVR